MGGDPWDSRTSTATATHRVSSLRRRPRGWFAKTDPGVWASRRNAPPGGEPGRYTRTLHQEAGARLAFEVDEASLDEGDRLYESAGLFAWRETLLEFSNWNAPRIAQVIDRALRSMRLTPGSPLSCNQLALFDPEFGQWNFVPFDGEGGECR